MVSTVRIMAYRGSHGHGASHEVGNCTINIFIHPQSVFFVICLQIFKELLDGAEPRRVRRQPHDACASPVDHFFESIAVLVVDACKGGGGGRNSGVRKCEVSVEEEPGVSRARA